MSASQCATAACCRRHPKACRASHVVPAPSVPLEPVASEAATVRAAAAGGSVIITHTTGSNLPFARNWYAHLQRAGVSSFVLIATDAAALAALRTEVPGHVVRCPPAIDACRPHGADDGPRSYRSRGWTRLMFAVPQMLRWVLAMQLDVLWMDTDVVALADPLPVLRDLLGANASSSPPQLLASVDGRFPDEDPRECAQYYSAETRWGASAGGSKLCGGLFYLRHGARSLALVDAWEARLRGPRAGAKNQPHYNDALRAAAGLRVRVLPCDLFPNGYRYASESWRRAQRRPPLAVHNNWIKGHAAKLARFKEWGLWREHNSPS